MESIDQLILSVPSEGIPIIGISTHSDDEDSDADGGLENQDPQRLETSRKMQQLWNAFSERLKNSIDFIGLCDLETDIFINLYNQASNPPSNFQVNLKSCCVVPPNLKSFVDSKKVPLLTHSDSPTVLEGDFCQEITHPQLQQNPPDWIIRYQLFIKARGVLQDKRYLIQLK